MDEKIIALKRAAAAVIASAKPAMWRSHGDGSSTLESYYIDALKVSALQSALGDLLDAEDEAGRKAVYSRVTP